MDSANVIIAGIFSLWVVGSAAVIVIAVRGKSTVMDCLVLSGASLVIALLAYRALIGIIAIIALPCLAGALLLTLAGLLSAAISWRRQVTGPG